MKQTNESFVSFRHFGILVFLLSALFLFGGWKKGQKKQTTTKGKKTSNKQNGFIFFLPKSPPYRSHQKVILYKKKNVPKYLRMGYIDKNHKELLLPFHILDKNGFRYKNKSRVYISVHGFDRPRMIIAETGSIFFLNEKIKPIFKIVGYDGIDITQDERAIVLADTYYCYGDPPPFNPHTGRRILFDYTGKVHFDTYASGFSPRIDVLVNENYTRTLLLTELSCDKGLSFLLNEKGKIIWKSKNSVFKASSYKDKVVYTTVQYLFPKLHKKSDSLWHKYAKNNNMKKLSELSKKLSLGHIKLNFARFSDMKTLWTKDFHRVISTAINDKYVAALAVPRKPQFHIHKNKNHKLTVVLYLFNHQGEMLWKRKFIVTNAYLDYDLDRDLIFWMDKKHVAFNYTGNLGLYSLKNGEKTVNIDMGYLHIKKILPSLAITFSDEWIYLINKHGSFIYKTHTPTRLHNVWIYKHQLFFATQDGIYRDNSPKLKKILEKEERKAK